MLHIISLYWNVFVLYYTVNARAVVWKLEWNFGYFVPLNIFIVIGLDSLSHSTYFGGIFYRAEYITMKFYSCCGLPLIFGRVHWSHQLVEGRKNTQSPF